MPTHDEIEAIELITAHVADAIMWSRGPQLLARHDLRHAGAPVLKLVSNNQHASDPAARLVALVDMLRSKAADLDRYADRAESKTNSQHLSEAAKLTRKLVANIMLQIELVRSEKRAR